MSDENKKSAINHRTWHEIWQDTQKDYGDTLFEQGKEIAGWPDYKFSSDNRTFGFFEDGQSIGKRLDAKGFLVNKHDRDRLLNTAGMIIQTVDGEVDDPMVFRDHEPLVKMWFDLHKSHGVPLSEEELIAFEFDLEPDENDEEGEDKDGDKEE
jgi:hypothetical protein